MKGRRPRWLSAASTGSPARNLRQGGRRATEERELPALEELRRRARANGVPNLPVLGPERLREIELHSRGLCALQVEQGALFVHTSQLAQSLEGSGHWAGRLATLSRRAWNIQFTGTAPTRSGSSAAARAPTATTSSATTQSNLRRSAFYERLDRLGSQRQAKEGLGYSQNLTRVSSA